MIRVISRQQKQLELLHQKQGSNTPLILNEHSFSFEVSVSVDIFREFQFPFRFQLSRLSVSVSWRNTAWKHPNYQNKCLNAVNRHYKFTWIGSSSSEQVVNRRSPYSPMHQAATWTRGCCEISAQRALYSCWTVYAWRPDASCTSCTKHATMSSRT